MHQTLDIPIIGLTFLIITFLIITFLIITLLIISLGLFITYQRAYGLVHPARTVLTRRPTDVGISDYEQVAFVTTDGLTLKGWLIPPQNGALVIFVHGHASNRNEFLPEAALITAQGYGALLFDLRNHGESAGNLTSLGLNEAEDVKSAVRFLRAQPKTTQTKIALFGHSMGAGAAILAAVENPDVSAVIAMSPFTSLEDNISDGVRELAGLPPFPFAPLVVYFCEKETGLNLHAMRPLDVIGQISPRALLLIHGEKDRLFLVKNSHLLYAAAHQPKQLYILPNATHSGLLQAEPEHFPATILSFLESHLQ